MKKHIANKLTLTTETVANLSHRDLSAVVGGAAIPASKQVTWCVWDCIKLSNAGTCATK